MIDENNQVEILVIFLDLPILPDFAPFFCFFIFLLNFSVLLGGYGSDG